MKITDAINMSEKQGEIDAALGRITKLFSLDELQGLRPRSIVRTRFTGDAELKDIKAMVYEGNEKFVGIFFENIDSTTLIETYGFRGLSINENNGLSIDANKVNYKLLSRSSEEYTQAVPIVRGVQL